MSDIAEKVGCSPATVSRALRDSPRISKETRQRVIEAARTLNYWGNATARSLRQRESRQIGLVIPTVQHSHYYHDTYLLHDALASEGYGIILYCHHNEPSRDEDILRTLMRHGVDGIIHFPCTFEGAEAVLGTNATIPIVELGLRSNTSWIDSIYTDESSGIRQLVAHLAALEHKRIALIDGQRGMYHVQVHTEAFHEALSTAGLQHQKCPIYNGPAVSQWARETTSEIIDGPNRPTALIVANSPMILGALTALQQAQIAVPEQISLAGLSNEGWYAVCRPSITAYEQPFREMGMMAAQTLIRRLRPDADAETPTMAIEFAGRLLARDSTALAYQAKTPKRNGD